MFVIDIRIVFVVVEVGVGVVCVVGEFCYIYKIYGVGIVCNDVSYIVC